MEMKAPTTRLNRQEIVRRRRNTHPGEKQREMEKEMNIFMMKLKMSGYTRDHRWEILKSGTRKYNRMVQDEADGKRRVNRPKWEGGHRRYLNKLVKKNSWYKRSSKDSKINRTEDKQTTRERK